MYNILGSQLSPSSINLVSWEGNRRSGVALAMRYSITTYRLTALGREMSSRLRSSGVWHTLPYQNSPTVHDKTWACLSLRNRMCLITSVVNQCCMYVFVCDWLQLNSSQRAASRSTPYDRANRLRHMRRMRIAFRQVAPPPSQRQSIREYSLISILCL